ncbi:MAG: UDP-glucose/GDP-mannose dehydrogenase family protein [Crocinitomicaceae bacterium]|nr:UDP-glucose/GDP-mannose dehydrogenase family protein [Crocinitomicaceae bacterium]
MSRTQNVTVIGVGKLGLGFALLLEEAGYDVLGVDIFPNYVNHLNAKKYNTLEPEYTELLEKSTKFRATVNLKEGLDHADLIFIIVQTPNGGGDKFYDHTILSNVLCEINKNKVENKDIIIGCTVMPTYIDTIGKLLISNCMGCTLSYNPEFVAQGDIIRGFRNPDIILVGTESESVKTQLTELYRKCCVNVPKYCFMTPLESEIVKIGLNSFITTKISFANMLSDLCDTLNANKNIVLNAIGSDSRVGNKYFRPGFSFGGPCFPRDTKACKLLLDTNGIRSDLLTATTKYNEDHIVFQTQQYLNENREVYIFENVCYKENSRIPLIEESAKLKIAKELQRVGKRVIIKDYAETIQEVKKEYGVIFEYIIRED